MKASAAVRRPVHADRRAPPRGARWPERRRARWSRSPSRVVAFGDNALEAFALLGDNQDRTSRWSIPQRAADGIAALTGRLRRRRSSTTRAACSAVLLVVALVLLLRAAWRRRDVPGGWIAPAGWATLGVLVDVGVARALVRDLAAAAGRARRGPPAARREHRALRLHDGDRRAARALLALLSRVFDEFDLIAKMRARPAPRGERVVVSVGRRRRGRARRRRRERHVGRRVRRGRALPARDHVAARPRAQVPGGLALRHRRDGRRAGRGLHRARPARATSASARCSSCADGARGAGRGSAT